MKSKGAGVILYSLDKDKTYRTLLGKRVNNPGKDQWGVPGGGMEIIDKDDFENTAIRECLEETGINISKPLIEFDSMAFANCDWKTYIYEVPLEKRRLFIEEMEESNWFDLNSLPSPLVSLLDEELERLKKQLNY